jgi:taurine dioxygenase
MKVVPVTPAIGAEVFGVNLARTLSPDQWTEIRDAFLRHQVLFFRDQERLSPQAQLDFGRRFGDLHIHPAAPSLEGYPEIMVVRADQNSKKHFGEVWHSDVSCDPEPPSATILQLHILPPSGGDTLFASMYAAWEALSAPMQQLLLGLTADHESEHYYRGRYAGVSDSGKTYPRAEHPVITVHPETGRRSIFVNSMFTTRIRDLTVDESRSILRFLFDHVQNPYFQCRLQWRENDVAVWDNRCTQHLAIWDYWPHTREGQRVTIRGTRPHSSPAD